MKYLLLILTFNFNLFAFDFFNVHQNYNYHILNFEHPFQVVILQKIPYAPYEKETIKDFQNKVIKFSILYKREATKRNIKTELPFNKFIFQIGFNGIPNSEYYKGYCDSLNNLISLEPNFSIKTFFHELGHCDLGYSHKEDENVSKVGASKYLMNWKYDPDYYDLTVNEVLDQFFDYTQHNPLDSYSGNNEHALMISQIKSYEEGKKGRKENQYAKSK